MSPKFHTRINRRPVNVVDETSSTDSDNNTSPIALRRTATTRSPAARVEARAARSYEPGVSPSRIDAHHLTPLEDDLISTARRRDTTPTLRFVEPEKPRRARKQERSEMKGIPLIKTNNEEGRSSSESSAKRRGLMLGSSRRQTSGTVDRRPNTEPTGLIVPSYDVLDRDGMLRPEASSFREYQTYGRPVLPDADTVIENESDQFR
ncbi:uncharacterized protein LOC142354439 isoform X2 [Convolutriloba macropyga]|uniref:uncharacterized protein LOC142354439 isoform X2 n=1 Tax=Convolutriloba macropyga TaxID=536237 RepID=UPI003F521E0C